MEAKCKGNVKEGLETGDVSKYFALPASAIGKTAVTARLFNFNVFVKKKAG